MNGDSTFINYCNLFGEEIRLNTLVITKGTELLFFNVFPKEIIQFINSLYVKCKIEEYGSTKISCGNKTSIIGRNGLMYYCGLTNANNPPILEFQSTGIKDVDLCTFSNTKSSPDVINDCIMYQQKNKILRYVYGNDNISNSIINLDAIQIKSGTQNTFIITKENDLFGCGDNGYGQLGLGRYTPYCYSFCRIDISNVISVECGLGHTLVLTKEGLFGCGNNHDNQLGLINRHTYMILTKIDIDNVISFACGMYHSLILTKEGLFYCGSKHNQDRRGSKHNQDKPVRVRTYIETEILQGYSYCFIINNFMKLPIHNIISFSCGYNYSLILTKKGLIEFTTTSGDQYIKRIDYMKNVLSISCGKKYAIVLTKEGLFGRGKNKYGQLGLGDCDTQDKFTKIVF